jgi:hypothetical protein
MPRGRRRSTEIITPFCEGVDLGEPVIWTRAERPRRSICSLVVTA